MNQTTAAATTAAALADWVENTMSLRLREIVFYGGTKGAREVRSFIRTQMRAEEAWTGSRATYMARKIAWLWESHVGYSDVLWDLTDPTGEYRRMMEQFK